MRAGVRSEKVSATIASTTHPIIAAITTARRSRDWTGAMARGARCCVSGCALGVLDGECFCGPAASCGGGVDTVPETSPTGWCAAAAVLARMGMGADDLLLGEG